VVEVVRGLLARLGADRGELLVGAGPQRDVERQLERGQEQQLGDHVAEVGLGALDQPAVAELLRRAQVGQRVLVPAGAFRRAGAFQRARVRQQQPGRAELVEPDVGQRHVFLHLGRGGIPGPEPLGRDQRVVAQPQHIVNPRGHRC
jgi:hypothetical protein